MSMFSGGGCRVSICSAEATGFTLGLEQTEDVTLADGALNVTDEGTGGSGAALTLSIIALRFPLFSLLHLFEHFI